MTAVSPPAGLRRIAEWLPEILLVAVTTSAGLWAGGKWINPIGDVGSWWSVTFRLANGELLYRNVYPLQFGPLSPYLLAFGGRIFGVTAPFFALVLWLAAVGSAFLLLRVARPILNPVERVGLVGLVLAIGLFAPGDARLVFPYAPGAVHALIFSLGSLHFVRPGRITPKSRALLAGMMAGFAFAAKQEIGLACLVALAAPALLRQERSAPWIGWAVAGFLVPVGLGSIATFLSAPFESLRENSHVWPLAPSPPASWLRLYREVAGVAVADWGKVISHSVWLLLLYITLSSLAALLWARERNMSCWLPAMILMFLLIVIWASNGFAFDADFHPISLSMIVSFGVAAAALLLRRLPERTLLLALGLFAGLLGARTAFSTHFSGAYAGVAHFGSSLTWFVFLCLVAPLLLCGTGKPARTMRRLVAIALLLFSWLGALAGIRALASEGKEAIETPQGKISVEHRLVPLFRSMRREILPGASIWVLPEINGVDAIFRAQSVSPYLSHMPGWLDEDGERRLVASLKSRPPDIVVVFERETREYGVQPFGIGFDRLLAQWIAATYVPVERARGGTLYRRRVHSTEAADRSAPER